MLLAMAATTLMGAAAQAQQRGTELPKDDGCGDATAGQTKDQEGRLLVFDSTKMGGCHLGPFDKNITVRPRARFDPLIKVRANFTPELQKSVNQL
jgi:hypothetical protein